MGMNKNKFSTIDEYISQFPDSTAEILKKVRAVISETAPKATETISYQIPTFKLKENLVHFAGYEHHIGFYPGGAALESFKDQIQKYKHAKGSVQFPLSEPIPYDLIKQITKFRLDKVKEKFPNSDI